MSQPRHYTRAARRRSQPASSPEHAQQRRDLILIGAVVLGMAVYRFVTMGADPGPPGSDGGNWLAYTQGLFGDSPKAAESMYFPGALVLLQGLLIFLPPLHALKTLAVLSSVAVAVPFFFIARHAVAPVTAAFLALLLLMSGLLLEVMVWGGYPQLLGTAYLVAALYFLDRWLTDAKRSDLIWGAVSAALVVFTHHFTFMVMIPTLATYLAFAAWHHRSDLRPFVRSASTWALAAGVLSLLALPWYVRYLSLLVGPGSLSASRDQLTSLGDILSFVFSEAPVTWLILGSVVPLIALLPLGGAAAGRLRPIAAALVAGPLVVFGLTQELRSVQPMQAGMLLSLGLVAAYFAGALKNVNLAPPVRLAGHATYVMGGLALALILLPSSHARYQASSEVFGALDPQAVEALDWLRENTPPDSIVLPGARHGAVSYTWWVEGYAQRPAYALISPRFLAFEEEHEQSAVVRRIMDEETPAAEKQALMEDAGITYLFIFKPSGSQFRNVVESMPFYLSFENDEFAILRLADEASARR